MSGLNQTTRRRLQGLQQIASVWEGDRRPLSALSEALEPDAQGGSESIIWVDGSEGMVRSMDVVSPEMGPEAMVRTLLRAMEHPQSPALPARPTKIVVRNREIQFFLRGVLQDLEIAIEYASALPLIDELFRGFEQIAGSRQPKLPPKYASLLIEKASELWKQAPWELIADHNLLSIELNQWDISTLYVCVMGMLGMEYGILLYRSLDSLRRFRSSVVGRESFESMEQAFLEQDCLFLTFGQEDDEFEDDEDDEIDIAELPLSEIIPSFGAVHPLEGMRLFLYEEEALAVYMAIEALLRFLRGSYQQLGDNNFPTINKRFRLPIPESADLKPTATVKVSTLPELSSELLELSGLSTEEDDWEDDDELTVPLKDDLVPKDAFLSLGMISWESVEKLRSGVDCYQSMDVKAVGEGMPVILIQTTRPKAKVIIEQIKTAGGLKGICFNPGEDPLEGQNYDLGILQTQNSNLYLFGEFPETDSTHVNARKKWEQRCKMLHGYCGLIIARGLKGSSAGNPQPRDMMALFEAQALSAKQLGLGMLQLIPEINF